MARGQAIAPRRTPSLTRGCVAAADARARLHDVDRARGRRLRPVALGRATMVPCADVALGAPVVGDGIPALGLERSAVRAFTWQQSSESNVLHRSPMRTARW